MLGSRPCQLVPPCKDGNHTRSPGIPRTTSPIGKYFFTEGALKHDLQALRRGAVYIKDEFYKRAKAWYKAEIDRRLHLERVREEQENSFTSESSFMSSFTSSVASYSTSDTSFASSFASSFTSAAGQQPSPPSSQVEDTPDRNRGRKRSREPATEQDSNTARKQRKTATKKPAKPETAPTRVQPSRSAKRKIADYAVFDHPNKKHRSSTESESRRTSIDSESNTSRPTSSGTAAKAAIIPNPTTDTPEYTPETKGDYELAEYDWQQFQNHNSGEHPPALSHIQLALLGLDVAYFSIRLEKAVNSKVTDLLHNKRTSALDLELGPGRSYMCAAGAAFHNHHLDSHSTPPTAPSEEEEGDREEKEFKPAAAFSPGEDWRPPTTTTTSGTVRNGLSFWAVGCRRSSSDKNAKAPEAEMETSPTLGKWPFNTENAPADSFKDLPLEDYTESKSIVEVSGLKFAVDVCATWDLSEQEELEGGRQGACIVML